MKKILLGHKHKRQDSYVYAPYVPSLDFASLYPHTMHSIVSHFDPEKEEKAAIAGTIIARLGMPDIKVEIMVSRRKRKRHQPDTLQKPSLADVSITLRPCEENNGEFKKKVESLFSSSFYSKLEMNISPGRGNPFCAINIRNISWNDLNSIVSDAERTGHQQGIL